MDNGTWERVDLPADRVVVNSMWVYKIKSDTEGALSRFKARFVAKGCSQRAGLDYTETFSPVMRMASLRLFLTIAAAMDLEQCQLDIDNAFLDAQSKRVFTFANPSASLTVHLKCATSNAASTGSSSPPREFNILLRY
jgi:hypothetical protein